MNCIPVSSTLSTYISTHSYRRCCTQLLLRLLLSCLTASYYLRLSSQTALPVNSTSSLSHKVQLPLPASRNTA